MDKYTKTPWPEYYEGGKWNADGGNFDSLNIMVKLFHQLMANEQLAEMFDGLRKKPRARVFDYGCGEGDGTVFLQSILPYARVIGVDLEPSAIEKAKARWTERDVEWVVGDVTKAVGPCDLLVSTTTMDHVEDIGGCVERLQKVSPWVVVNWGCAGWDGHPSHDLTWTETCPEPFWSHQYPQPRVVENMVLKDSFQVFVWRGK